MLVALATVTVILFFTLDTLETAISQISLITEKSGVDTRYFTAVMNQRYEGGGFKFCPDARPDDGQLDMILVEGVGKLMLLF